MISMRQHAVSLIAVFLALALGLFLGSGFIGDRLNSLTGTDRDRYGKLQDEREDLSRQVNVDNGFITALQPKLVGGVLDKRGVLLVSAPDAADADIQEIRGLINDAGGSLAGQIGLTTDLVRDQNGAKLGSIIDQSIPAGQQLRVDYTDSGSRLGDLLGVTLLNRDGGKPVADADRNNALQALREGGFITYTDGVKPASLVIVVTGGAQPSDAGAQGQLVGRLAVSLASRGQGGVLAGRAGSDGGGAAVALVRSDPSMGKEIATVDDVDAQVGRITTILALGDAAAGRTGAYGTGQGASAITVGGGKN
ncbi:MAG: copper transporter [Gordonia sp. (in: high G+C Gram-positive bacteria)]|uniref:copper transporter n=1 Tax=Gordonia sp. (in: high G+C Gram-positive bacteria) TaxID=84139 RepID=UPI0039E35129